MLLSKTRKDKCVLYTLGVMFFAELFLTVLILASNFSKGTLLELSVFIVPLLISFVLSLVICERFLSRKKITKHTKSFLVILISLGAFLFFPVVCSIFVN